MVENHLVKCEDCGHEFEKGEWINECPNCEEVYCESCWKQHNCLAEEWNQVQLNCSECGRETIPEDIKECPYCYEPCCEDCWDEHSKEHIDEDMKPVEYSEYVEKKFLEEL